MKTVLALLILGLLLLGPITPTEAATLQPSANAKGEQRTLADRDGDGLSDHLQQQLEILPPSEPLAVVVTFSAPGNADHAQRAVGPFKVKREFRIINGFAATMTAGQAKALAKAPGVFRVEEDFQVTTMINAANQDFGIAAARSTFGVSGAGVGICIVDTGVDPGHEQLDSGKVAGFVDYVNNQLTAYDDHGHGTHVAAIAAGDGSGGANAATFQGVAPGAAIYAAKVLDSSGSGADSGVISGVEWCADQTDVQIISMSLGSGSSSDGQDSLSQAVNSAVAAGKVVVVAAGNSGDGEETVGSPGAAAGAITVGAVAEWSAPPSAPNHSKGIYLAPFSSRGPTLDKRMKPDISAPGVSVTSAQAGSTSGYITWSGTSMATPFVSGTVALALQSNSNLSPAAVKNYLMATAQDRGPAGTDNDWGAGLLDGYQFVADALGDSTADPTPFPHSQRTTATVPINGTTQFPFAITSADLGVPIAATLTILNGETVCIYGSALVCDLLGGWAWTPDIDAELIHPNGTVLARSECPLSGDCGTVGRQETLYYLPTAATDIGTYRLRMYQFSSDPGGAQEGNVSIGLSTGPVQTGPPPNENNLPVANNNNYSTAEDTPLNIPAPGVLDNDTDIDGDDLNAVLGSAPSHGTLTLSTAGSFTYTPVGNYNGPDVFNYRANDGTGNSNLATVTITVTPVNDLPVAANDSYTTAENTQLSITAPGILGNDTDIDSDSLIAILSTSPIHGTLTINTNGSFIYTPASNYSGQDSFAYRAYDGTGTSNLATVSITVTPAAPSLHIGDLDGSAIIGKRSWTATVTITVHDATHKVVNGAVVSGSWSDGKAASCTTARRGQCKLTSNKLNLGVPDISFTVATLNGATSTFIDDLDGDNVGMSITVKK
jgi:serine protease AprX